MGEINLVDLLINNKGPANYSMFNQTKRKNDSSVNIFDNILNQEYEKSNFSMKSGERNNEHYKKINNNPIRLKPKQKQNDSIYEGYYLTRPNTQRNQEHDIKREYGLSKNQDKTNICSNDSSGTIYLDSAQKVNNDKDSSDSMDIKSHLLQIMNSIQEQSEIPQGFYEVLAILQSDKLDLESASSEEIKLLLGEIQSNIDLQFFEDKDLQETSFKTDITSNLGNEIMSDNKINYEHESNFLNLLNSNSILKEFISLHELDESDESSEITEDKKFADGSKLNFNETSSEVAAVAAFDINENSQLNLDMQFSKNETSLNEQQYVISSDSKLIENKSHVFKVENSVPSNKVSSADVISQIVDKAKLSIKEGKSEMLIEMKPDALGKVALKVLTENDMVVAKFITDNYHVKEILEANFQALKDSLEENGLIVQGFSVSVQDQSSRNNHSGNQTARNFKEKNKTIYKLNRLNMVDDYGLRQDDIVLDKWNGSKINLRA